MAVFLDPPSLLSTFCAVGEISIYMKKGSTLLGEFLNLIGQREKAQKKA